MGGKAFNPENLSTPRMPPSVYHLVKSRITALLRTHFRHADSPIDGPGKTDFGDIDILVFDPVDPKLATDYEGLASIVGAKRWKRIAGSDTVNFAVPYPTNDADVGGEGQERFMQLDICITGTLAKWEWLLFLHAHGDLFMVLGQSLRRFGLSLTPSGFHLHIPEMEGQNKGLSRVKITDEPGQVLGYLGLDEEVFNRGVFEKWDDMLGYAASSRFMDLGRGARKREYERLEAEEAKANSKTAGEEVQNEETSGADTPTSSETPGQTQDTTFFDATTAPSTAPVLSPISGDPIPKDENGGPSLKANDRQRERKRPLFAYYLNVYIPLHGTLDTPPGSAAKLTKQEVIVDAKEYFGEQFAERYEECRAKAMRTVGLSQLWVRVREVVKQDGGEGDGLGYGMKGMKKAVEGELEGYIGGGVGGLAFDDVVAVRKAFEEMMYDEVVLWAKRHWKQVGEIQKGIDNVNGAKKLGEKKRKEKKAVGEEGETTETG